MLGTGPVGPRIRGLRKAKNLRVEDLAATTGLAARTITRIEAGKDARISTLQLVADALDTTLSDLLEEAS